MNYLSYVLVLVFLAAERCSCRSMKAVYDSDSIKCYISDFPCFRAQYQQIRNMFLLGNRDFNISAYKSYVFHYGSDQKCIKLTGLHHSELIGISYDSFDKEFSVTLHSPLKIQEETKQSGKCEGPDFDLNVTPLKELDIPQYLRKFIANCTIKAMFMYNLVMRNDKLFMQLDDPDIEMTLDIPDLSGYDTSSLLQKQVYEASEWAYLVVQQFDVGEKIALPFIQKYRTTINNLPLEEYILIRRKQKYDSLSFELHPEELLL